MKNSQIAGILPISLSKWAQYFKFFVNNIEYSNIPKYQLLTNTHLVYKRDEHQEKYKAENFRHLPTQKLSSRSFVSRKTGQ